MSSALLVRSVYSLLSSMCKIEDIVSYGKTNGYKAIGLVDKNVLAGCKNFKIQCEKQGIKPIYGLEVDVRVLDRINSVVLYAKNDAGFRNLMGLSSYINTCDNKLIDIDVLNKYKENNILCLLSDDMPLTYGVDNNLDVDELLAKQKELFGDYIVGLVDHNVAINKNRDKRIKELLKQNNIFYIALNRTYFIDKDDANTYEVLKCIRDKKTINDIDISDDSNKYFLTTNELNNLYEREELDNLNKLVDMCSVSMSFNTSLPKYVNKNNVTSKEYLLSLCKEGLKRRLKDSITVDYTKRLDYELSIILKMHFEDYFLIVYDFILYAKKHNIMVGPARGSAGGSLVAYCLGITEIDPIKYGLIFERFLNPERISMPDIDTDFPDDRRDEVINYVKDKYGKDHVAHIITYGTLKAKQVLRDVGRAMNYTTNEIDSLCKSIPASNANITLDEACNINPIFKQKINSEAKYRKLFEIAKKLEGNPRHESTHAAGIVFSSEPLTNVIPLIKIEDDLFSTQYTMEHLEQMGLIKMDFLGLRNLSIISEIVDDINKTQTFNIKDIPLNDKKTFALIDNVNVLGVFQLESSGMQNLIRKMKPKTFEEIGMTLALFRPGPMENIPVFLSNRENPENIDYIVSSLKPILQETYGVIVYQEQIMNIARIMAGFTYGKADVLRKAMSKKKAAELEKLYPDFIDGCMANGYTKDISNKVYDLIMKFANYGFNKSHSIGYGMVAYQMAYLKANYPLYFYKALLNGTIGSESKTYDYINECQNIGQKVKGISINNSQLTYTVKDNNIVMPFTICKDVGVISANKIIEERNENGLFDDYIKAVTRLVIRGVDKNVIENLIYAGAFDELNHSRYTMIKSLDNVLMYANAHKSDASFFDEDDMPLINEYKDDMMILSNNEKKVLGFYFSYNPIVSIKKAHNINTDNLYNLSNSFGYGKGFGLIQRVKEIKTKKGDRMAFVDVIDDKGEISLAVMPNVYSNYLQLLEKGKYVYFEGNIEKQGSCLVKKMDILGE